MRKTFSLTALLAMAALALPAAAHSPGDWVLANYKGSGYWFAGVVASVAGDSITVAYDDGDREVLRPGNVRPYTWKVGTRVSCNWKREGEWYSGKITKLNNVNLRVSYDDGDVEDTHTGQCRSE